MNRRKPIIATAIAIGVIALVAAIVVIVVMAMRSPKQPRAKTNMPIQLPASSDSAELAAASPSSGNVQTMAASRDSSAPYLGAAPPSGSYYRVVNDTGLTIELRRGTQCSGRTLSTCLNVTDVVSTAPIRPGTTSMAPLDLSKLQEGTFLTWSLVGTLPDQTSPYIVLPSPGSYDTIVLSSGGYFSLQNVGLIYTYNASAAV